MTHPAMDSLSIAEARRVALAAQGFANTAKLRARKPFDAALQQLHVLQIDSVNVFARSHYMPVFSRHGGYSCPGDSHPTRYSLHSTRSLLTQAATWQGLERVQVSGIGNMPLSTP